MENAYIVSFDRFFTDLENLYSQKEEHYRHKLVKFFKPLIFKYRVAKEIKKQTDKFLASDFNLVDIIAPDENKVSDIIASILEPNGKHGQGAIFLIKFLETLEKLSELSNRDISYNKSGTTQVIRESSTDKGRRIDIVLKFDSGFMIGIENKPWAGEQENQLEDYSKYLAKESKGNYLLIYLDGMGRESTSIKDKKQLEKENRFLETSYHRLLIPWITECIKECEAEKVRWFLRDFVTWIELNFKEEEKYD